MKIEVLYPEVANLYGDLENVDYLKKSCAGTDDEIEIVETHLWEEPLFVREKPQLVYMGTMKESSQHLAKTALSKYRDELKARIDDGTLFLITGNALEIFGSRIEDKDGSGLECLGFFPTVAKRDMLHRFNSLYLGEFEGMEIAGYKSQFTHSYEEKIPGCLYDSLQSVFETKRGPGLNPDVTEEGIRQSNFIATYVIGPILILNPPFAKWMLAKMGIENPKLAFEEAATEAYNVRIAEYSDPATGFYY